MRFLAWICLLFAAANLSFSNAMSTEEAMASIDEEKKKDAEEFTGHGVFSDAEVAEMAKTEETHAFQAEVTRLMDIIINALYGNREVFLRELMSNSADALDKIRFQALKNPEILGSTTDLEIKISVDEKAHTITVRDTGVGMTKEELIKNLGIVAKSGTTEFVEQAMQGGADAVNLIGQFGVGFYSVYLVGDRVTVASKHNNDEQYVWQSNADRSFTVSKDPRGNTLGRGTSVTIHVKEDAREFVATKTLRGIVEKYSQFLNFPIYLEVTNQESREVPDDSAEEEDEVVVDMDGENADGEDAEKKPKMKTIREDVKSWERVNPTKAMWTRSPKDITEDEYNEFYKSFTKDTVNPLQKTHFTAEGEITFRSLLYVPTKVPEGLYDNYVSKTNTNINLYVRRVLISDEFDELLPRYLNFIKGVVDSDDLPLTVSRESLSQSRVIKVMSKKITRKALEMLKDMADEEIASNEDTDEDDEESEKKDDEESEKKEKKVSTIYTDFWTQYSKSIKLGVLEDKGNRNKLSKLLRFYSNLSPEKLISLDDYVEGMTDKQRHIYYISGASMEEVKNSPFLERVVALGYEVLFFIDSLDEYISQHLTEYEGNQLMSITKEGLKLGGEEKKVAKWEDQFKTFTTWFKDHLGKKVEKVVVSPRLTTSPAIIVTSQYGWSANMQRISQAQHFADKTGGSDWMHAKKTLEINPRHPLIQSLKQLSVTDPESSKLKDLADLLFDTATVQSGFGLDDNTKFAERVLRTMGNSLDIDMTKFADDIADEPSSNDEGDGELHMDENGAGSVNDMNVDELMKKLQSDEE